MDNISKYINYKEAVKTNVRHAKNIPNADQLSAMRYVATRVFDPVREFVGGALYVSSFFRSAMVNKAIGGSTTSQHCKGEAIDIDCDVYGNGTNKEVFEYIKENLPFDQLIGEGLLPNGEFQWVHVSLRRDNKNRKQVLLADFSSGKTVYKNYI